MSGEGIFRYRMANHRGVCYPVTHSITAPLPLTRFSGSVRSAPNSAPLTCSACDCMPARWCDCESTFNRAYIKIYLAYCSQVEIRKSAAVQCSRLRIKNGVVITETTWIYQDNLCIRYYSCYLLRTIRICRLLNKHDSSKWKTSEKR